MNLPKKIKTFKEIWRKDGWNGIKNKFSTIYRAYQQKRDYRIWVLNFDSLTDSDRQKIKSKIENFSIKPLFSIILPVYNVEEKWLRKCLDSVLNQLYSNWELCISDDFSPSPHIRRVLEEYAARDARIKVIFRSENGHISAASNSALELATGEFVALLDHDDEISEHALYYVANEINCFPQTQMIYSDEDMIDETGQRYFPKFKPDWSQDLFYSLNLITHLSVYSAEVLRKVGGFRIGFEGSQDYDLALRVIEQIDVSQIRHIPHILYHWRAIKGSAAYGLEEKPYAYEKARKALREHFERIGKNVSVTSTACNLNRVNYTLPKDLPKVSVIIFYENNLNEFDSFFEEWQDKTNYSNLEFILISSNYKVSDVKDFSSNIKFQYQGNRSKSEILNFAAAQTDSDIFCFIESETVPIGTNWLQELISFALQKEIGAVGAKIYSSKNTNLHCGIVLGIKGGIGFAFRKFMKETYDNMARIHVTNNFSAVSGVLAIRREVFDEIGRFDETNFKQDLFEVDFCLRLKKKKYRVVFTPYAEFVQTNSSKTNKIADSAEINMFKAKWQNLIENDEFYNPNFSLKNESFRIAIPPRIKKTWDN